MLAWSETPTDQIKRIVSTAIYALVQKYNEHPHLINNGDCDKFACELEEALLAKGLLDMEVLWGDEVEHLFTHPDHIAGAHCFLRVHDLYFDAEEPYGVPHPALLPIYFRQLHDFGDRHILLQSSTAEKTCVQTCEGHTALGYRASDPTGCVPDSQASSG